ncbi:protein O-mannosyl-transferase 2 isoform X1 [Macrosteles quadrilineatus]|uniref:protein O-mannosyl-transferase 2 isoform X1 n=1 Tax=Macrosteles quadrilineatus TaxID=74068 RepID=UPI0023E0BE1C|nr:protein O-mannosyl-transferase 2 isoform X1 [Macrosteles quadrilineatus]
MTVQKNTKLSENMSYKTWWMVFSTVVICSFLSRFYKVDEPDHVCWDETHFGKMGSWYIKRTFFFDVHPPLGKMLIALAGFLTGYDGNFPFEKPGDKYENVNYVGMRVFCTFLGACIPPLGFLTVWEMTTSLAAASFAALLILCDVGILTLTQYILLDPILLFFVMGSTYGMAKCHCANNKPFSVQWWAWLVFTGTMIACAVSVKFVGLFIVLLVGFCTVTELWDILGDISRPVTYTAKHFIARVICLIILPACLYMSFFYIHLTVLSKSGNGDGFYSSAFQSKLEGNTLHNASMPRDVAYGAVVTLKNHRTGGGYLHSHWHLYPEGMGARQQQVTTYTHKDENNKWLIKKYNSDVEVGEEDVELLKHGDLVRLEHVVTRRNLHSHREPAPVTKKHFQVTGYGENGTGDANDVWMVQVVGGVEGEVIHTVTSKLRFVHFLQHCILTTSGKQLPKWAYEQSEVSCNPNLRDKSAVWNVEDNIFAKLPNVSFEVYAPGFLERFIESHAVMLQGNAGLKPKEGEVTSRPWQWPIDYRGQFFSGSSYRIYLLGNPVIWWCNIVFLVIFLLVFLCNAVKHQRGYPSPPHIAILEEKMIVSSEWLFLGWCLHYVPFWAMGRVLYFHHYFPALLFSSMLTGVLIGYVLEVMPFLLPERIAVSIYHWLTGVIISAVVYSFYLFAPLAYGMSGPSATDPNSTMYGLRWMESWEF